MPDPDTLEVLVSGLEFYGYHGVSPEERTIGHHFSADVAVTLISSAPSSDRVADTVDYAWIAQCVTEVSAAHSCATVERLAGLICEHLLTQNLYIQTVDITLRKRLPPIPIPVDWTGVRLIRRRTSGRQPE